MTTSEINKKIYRHENGGEYRYDENNIYLGYFNNDVLQDTRGIGRKWTENAHNNFIDAGFKLIKP